jgi:FkbM family methyltransferase
MEYVRRSRFEGGLAGVGLSWSRKLREEFVWACRRNTGSRGPQARVSGGRLLVNPSDVGISKELLVYGVHEPAATAIMARLLRPGMTVLDVGANIGYYVLLEHRAVGPTGCVVAIEPAPRNAALLRENIALNALARVQVLDAAIGDRDGPGVLHISSKSNWNSMLPIDGSSEGTVDVQMLRLDTVVERLGLERIDLVRMDLEGYETTVFRGMAETLRRFRPTLVMELHPRHVPVEELRELLSTLDGLGYVARHLLERQADFSWYRGPEPVELPSSGREALETRLLRDGRVLTGFFEVPASDRGG